MKNFYYFVPRSCEESLKLLRKFGDEASLMAGGTDLLVRMKNNEIHPAYIIDMKQIPNLNRIETDGAGGLRIGALATLNEIESSPLIRQSFPILTEAASVLGSVQIRNKATIGGNLCHASPAADTAPPLIALGSTVKIEGQKGERLKRLEDFFIGPEVTALKPDEILTEIQIPCLPANSRGTYLKFSLRKAVALSVVGVAAVLTLDPENFLCTQANVVLGAVAPTPIRAKKCEQLLMGRKIDLDLINEASKAAEEESNPISDVRASASYRRKILRVLVGRAIARTLEAISI